jgi:hypothetical protein
MKGGNEGKDLLGMRLIGVLERPGGFGSQSQLLSPRLDHLGTDRLIIGMRVRDLLLSY